MKDRIKDILASNGIEPVSERLRHFEEWAVTRLWEQYDEEIMNQRLITENSMRQARTAASERHRRESHTPLY